MRPFVVLTVLGGLTMVAPPAVAQGFGIFEQGTCATARGGAVVARPCADGSAIYYNPSGLFGHHAMHHEAFTVSGGVTLINVTGDFTDDRTATPVELTNSAIPVPHLYLTHGHSDKIALGLGVYVPFGLGTRWPTMFEGRFNGYDNALKTIYIQPTVAYRLTEALTLGAGFVIADGSVKLSQYLDLSEIQLPGLPITFGALGIPFHTQFGAAVLDAGGAVGIGGNFGLTARLTESLTFGARYTTRVKLDYKGTATFAPAATGILLAPGNPFGLAAGTPLDSVVAAAFRAGGALVTQTVSTSITMPDQFIGGLGLELSPTLSLEADYQWTHWSLFSRLPVNFQVAPSRVVTEAYRDAQDVRVSAEWATSEKTMIRGGWFYSTAAAPDSTVTPLLPEGARNGFTAGLGWMLSGQLAVDLGYQYLRQNKRRGRTTEAPGGGAGPNSGLYTLYAHLIGATFTLHL
jgi:long-chain fatty acid transport protein